MAPGAGPGAGANAGSTGGTRTVRDATTAELYLELLKDRGIDVFLGNAGTDFASLVEGFARAEAEGRPAPRPLLVPHEFVAVSMAHGYYLGSGRPAAAMVHVTVGTGNAATALITASRANVPVLMSAGRTPVTEEGLPGRARPPHPLGPGELRPGGDGARVREVGLRAAHAGAAGGGGRSRGGADARRAARAGVPDPAPRGARGAPRRGDDHLAGAPPGAERALPRSRADRRGGADPRARGVAAGPRVRRGPGSARGRRAGRARRGRRDRRGRGRSHLPQLPPRSPAPPRLQPVGDDQPLARRGRRHPRHRGRRAVVPRARQAGAGRDDHAPRGRPVLLALPDAELPVRRAHRRRAGRGAAPARGGGAAPRRPRRPSRGGPSASPPSIGGARPRGSEAALEQSGKSTIGFAWAARCIGELLDEGTAVVNEYPLDRRFAAFSRPGSYFGSPHSSGLGFGLGAALG